MDEQIRAHIDKFGIAISTVEETGMWPNYAYTIGMVQSFDQPELICFGLPANIVGASLNTVADMARDGKVFTNGDRVRGVFRGIEVELRTFPKEQYADNLSRAVECYGSTEFPVLQLYYPDANGLFPWDAGSLVAASQPMFDQPAPRLGNTIIGTRIA